METTITLVRESYELIRSNIKLILKTLVRLFLITMAWLAGIAVLAVLVYLLAAVVKNTLLAVIVGVVAVIGLLIGSIYLQAWTYLAMNLALINQDPTVGSKIITHKAWGMVKRYWGLMIMSGLVVLGGMIPLVVPGIVVAITVSMAIYVFIEEGEGGLSGLLKSRFYTKSYRWRLVGRYLILMIAAGLVQLSLQELTKSQNLVLQIISSLLLIIFSIGWGTFLFAFGYRNFVWLKNQKTVEVFDAATARGKYRALAIWGGLALVVVVVVPIVVLVAINPAKQFSNSRDFQMKSTVETVGRGVEMYQLEAGQLPGDLEEVKSSDYMSVPVNTMWEKIRYIPDIDNGLFEVCGDLELGGEYCYPQKI